MRDSPAGPAPALGWAVAVLAFAAILVLRTWGISTRFLLLHDQIRDWDIALGPFSQLPLVGPATHFGGYTIGPAFYWILWGIRVLLGPFYENLPHAGGIGHAILQSGADVLLLLGVWRRSRSVWIALLTFVLISTAAFDLSLAPLVWNPVMGSTLAKAATALVLLDWHRGSRVRLIVVAAIAWSAVHAYTGAIYVAVGVFAAAVLDPLVRGAFREAAQRALVIAGVVAALQLPYAAHQIARRFADPAMGAVTGGILKILSGSAPAQFDKSLAGYVGAVSFIQGLPLPLTALRWLLLVCGGSVAFRYRRDPAVLAVTLLPPLLAIAGYALFLGPLEQYYYLSLMPAAVLTIVLGITMPMPARVGRALAIVMLAGAVLLVPGRRRLSLTMNQMPEYGAIVEASRTIARREMPMRAIRVAFPLQPTNDPEFVYRILGGRIDRRAPWIGIITRSGRAEYEKAAGS